MDSWYTAVSWIRRNEIRRSLGMESSTGDLIVGIYFRLVNCLERAESEEEEIPHRGVALDVADLEAGGQAAGCTDDVVV